MQNDAFRRLSKGSLFAACAGVCCLWTGALALHAAPPATPKNPTVKSSQDISKELDRETDLHAQLDRTLGPVTGAIKQTVAGAHRLKQHYHAGTPEYNQARELYARIRQNIGKLEGELTGAVQTVTQSDRGESAGRSNRQVIADVNDALQKFDDLINRVAPVPAPPPSTQPAPSPPPQAGSQGAQPPQAGSQGAQPPQAGQPSGQPTPPGLPVEPVQPEQYVQAQAPAGQISGEVVVQVCNLFVEHTLGLGNGSAESIRGQMIRQIRRQVSMLDFGSA